MIAPFGFSVGDFIALLALTRTVISGLKAQGGAIDACLGVVEGLETNVSIFEELESLDLPATHESQQNLIVRLAQDLHGLATSLLESVLRYSRSFAQPHAQKFYRAGVAKARWVTHMSKIVDKHRAEVESKSLSLRLLLSKVNMQVPAFRSFGITQLIRPSDMMTNLLKNNEISRKASDNDRQLSRSQHQSLMDRILTLQTSLHQIEAQESSINSVLYLLSKNQQTLMSDPQISVTNDARRTPLLLSSSVGVAGLHHSASDSRPGTSHSIHQRDIEYKSSLPRREDNLHSFQQSFSPHAPPTEWQTSQRFRSEGQYTGNRAGRLTVSKVLNGALSMGRTTFNKQKQVTLVSDQEEALASLSAGFYRLLQVLLAIYPQIAFIMMWLWTIPAAVSMLTSDDIVFEDFFGRAHSLPFEYFRDWSMMDRMLETRMRGTPGLQRVRNNTFVLEMWKGRKKYDVLYLHDWNSKITPGARVTMSAALKTTKMSVGTCARCNGPVTMMFACRFTCTDCNIVFRTWSSANKSSLHEVLRQTNTSRSAFLYDPQNWNPVHHIHRREIEEYNSRQVIIRRRIEVAHERSGEFLSDAYHRKAESAPTLERLPLIEKLPAFVQRLGNADELAKRLSTQIEPTPTRGLRTKIRWRRASGGSERTDTERKELSLFRRVSLREDAPLHSAALAGNVAAVRALLGQYSSPDNEKGIYGNPLTAAVLSGSVEVVKLLLDHGASPLKTMHPLPGPVELAASRNYGRILDLLLSTALELLGLEKIAGYGYQAHDSTTKRNQALRKIFSDLIDLALAAASRESALSSVQLLLFYGANPYAQIINGPSPFRIAWKAHDLDLLKTFIVETTARSLLSIDEAKSTSISDSSVVLFEDAMQQRMAARSQWHYPYYHGMPLADEVDMETVNREYGAWVSKESPTREEATFTIPHIYFNDALEN